MVREIVKWTLVALLSFSTGFGYHWFRREFIDDDPTYVHRDKKWKRRFGENPTKKAYYNLFFDRGFIWNTHHYTRFLYEFVYAHKFAGKIPSSELDFYGNITTTLTSDWENYYIPNDSILFFAVDNYLHVYPSNVSVIEKIADNYKLSNPSDTSAIKTLRIKYGVRKEETE